MMMMVEVGSFPLLFSRASGGFQKSPTFSHAGGQAKGKFLMMASFCDRHMHVIKKQDYT